VSSRCRWPCDSCCIDVLLPAVCRLHGCRNRPIELFCTRLLTSLCPPCPFLCLQQLRHHPPLSATAWGRGRARAAHLLCAPLHPTPREKNNSLPCVNVLLVLLTRYGRRGAPHVAGQCASTVLLAFHPPCNPPPDCFGT
jgi:hypothetical protein